MALPCPGAGAAAPAPGQGRAIAPPIPTHIDPGIMTVKTISPNVYVSCHSFVGMIMS